MPCYLWFDGTGTLTGAGVATAIPDGAVECTQDQYNAVPNVALQNGEIVSIPPVAASPITPVLPVLVQQAADAIGRGLTITSKGTPGITGIYPVSGRLWDLLKDEALFVTTYGGFSTGTSSIMFLLPNGQQVTFTATAQLLNVVKALGMYLTALETIAVVNAGTLPAASVAIA